MADPNTTPNAFGDELYYSVSPLAYGDADNDYALKTLCYALAQMFNQVELLARSDGTADPWSIIMDADNAPDYVLPYIAQFVGQTIPVGTPEADARQLIKDPSNQKRGSLPKLIYEAKRFLTGSQYVRVIERDTSPYHFSVFVHTSEVTDSAALAAALQAVKPAGLVMNLVISDHTTIDVLTGSIDSQTAQINNL
jgi:hypothetical protein